MPISNDGATYTVTAEDTPPIKPETKETQDNQTLSTGDDSGGTNGEQLLAGKFKSVADLEKGYAELSKKMGQASGQTSDQFDTKPQTDPVPEADKQTVLDIDQEAAKYLESKGLDMQTLANEFERTGALSEESYQALAKAGIDKGTVDQYIAGNRSLAQQQIDQVMNSVGGPDTYQAVVDWAKTTLSPAEQKAYNKILQSADMDAIKLAAAGLKARYEGVMGRDPKVTLKGSPAGGNQAAGYRSVDEMTRAMADPRYHTDPAYRDSVIQKVDKTNF